MNLFPDLCLCLLIFSGAAFSQQSGAVQQPVITVDETKNGTLLQCEVRGGFPKPKVEWWDSAGNSLDADKPQVTERGGIYNIILQTTVTKSDHYRCVATQEEIHNQIFTKTFVRAAGAASRPFITNLKQTNDQALLQCEVFGVSPKPEVFWKDDSGNIIKSEEPEVTERGGSYDVVLRTTVTKTDYYHCVVTQDEINHQVSARTHVVLGGSGAASEPSISHLKQTKGSAQLQCVIRGVSPKPEVFWKDDSGNIIKTEEPEVTERGGSYDVVLRATVTKTDYYYCVVTQDEINHQVSAKTHVLVESEFPIGWIVAAVLGIVVVIVVLVVVLHKRYSCNRGYGSPGGES